MLTIKGLSRSFQKLDTNKAIQNGVEKSLPEMIKRNKVQMNRGKTKFDTKISPSYRRNKYARIKNEMNPIPGLGTPDLYVTGDFQSKINMTLEGNVIIQKSSDYKAEWLEPKYDDIYGLGGDLKQEFQKEVLQPAINEEISKSTGLKF